MDFASEAVAAGDDVAEMRPNSSRVKKVLVWNPKRQEFEMSEDDKRELKEMHIKNENHWKEFEEKYRSLQPQDHPLIKKPSLCKKILLGSLSFIFLLLIAYCLFIILQLALFNLIMLVVMIVFLTKLFNVLKAISSRVLDNGQKKAFKQWIRGLKELDWLKQLAIEIQEDDTGRWIEIHLNETADERDEGIAEEDADDD